MVLVLANTSLLVFLYLHNVSTLQNSKIIIFLKLKLHIKYTSVVINGSHHLCGLRIDRSYGSKINVFNIICAE